VAKNQPVKRKNRIKVNERNPEGNNQETIKETMKEESNKK
jgi:hypothetical protein